LALLRRSYGNFESVKNRGRVADLLGALDPEFFSGPALESIRGRERRERLSAVPYFAGLMAGETDALIRSFAGEP
jgi:hypothetical protein